jgi:hypothetical protein
MVYLLSPLGTLYARLAAEQCNKRNVVRDITPYGRTEFPLIAIFIVQCGSLAW